MLRKLTWCLLAMFSLTRPVWAQATFERLHTFTDDGVNGFTPAGPMVQAANGWIYGLTMNSGPQSPNGGWGCGTAFRFDPSDPAFRRSDLQHRRDAPEPGEYLREGFRRPRNADARHERAARRRLTNTGRFPISSRRRRAPPALNACFSMLVWVSLRRPVPGTGCQGVACHAAARQQRLEERRERAQ